MKARQLLLLITLALGPITAMAQEDERTFSGKIDRVDKRDREPGKGVLVVGGIRVYVNEDTEIIDQTRRKTAFSELQRGLEVEVAYEETEKGTHAKRVTATLMR